MPNWCSNTLAVYGPIEDLKAFTDKASGEDFFSSFLPIPTDFAGHDSPERDPEFAALMRERHGAVDWYDWQVKNWGIKWDVRLEPLEDVESPDDDDKSGVIAWTFESPWSPPTTGIETISMLYPTLSFFLSYDEPGMDFAGYSWYRNGIEGSTGRFTSPSNAMRAIEVRDGYEAAEAMSELADLVAEAQTPIEGTIVD